MIKCFRKKGKRIAVFLSLAFVLSMGGCGKSAENDQRPRIESVFDLFNDVVEPDTSVTANTEQSTGGGDEIVDPPAIDTNKYASTESEEFNKLCDDYFKEAVTSNSSSYRDYIYDPKNFPGVEAPKEVTMGDHSTTAATLEEDKKDLEKWITRLEAIDVNTLTEQQRFDYDYMMDGLVSSRVACENINIGSPFSPMRGLQANIPPMFTDYIFRSKEDVQLYLDLMALIPDYVEGELKAQEEYNENGYAVEDCILEKMIQQCDDFLNVTGEHFMITDFNERIQGLNELTDAEREEFKKKNKELVEGALIPTYENMKKRFTSWKGKNKVKGGLCNYEDHGKEIYAYVVREYTGSSKTPSELITYLETKLAECKSEVQTIYLSNPSAYKEYESKKDTLFDYLSMDAGELESYLIKNVMSDYPDIGNLQFRALYFSKSMETIRENSLAYYMIPAIDDKDDNLIRVNGKNKSDMWVILAHEGCPGHMYQTNYYRKTNPRNFRLLGLELGYVEGWAVYASYDSLKYCDFNGSSFARELATLVAAEEKMGYTYYGLVDLGVNYQGWTVEDVGTFLTTMGLNASAAQEMYTIVVGDPGLYLSYSVGYYEMADMRAYAEQELGDKFSAVEYHKAVLDAGPCKYDQLKKKVDKYILEHK